MNERIDTFTRTDGVAVQQHVVEHGSVDLISETTWSGTVQQLVDEPERPGARLDMPLLRVYVAGTASNALLSIDEAQALVRDLNNAIEGAHPGEFGWCNDCAGWYTDVDGSASRDHAHKYGSGVILQGREDAGPAMHKNQVRIPEPPNGNFDEVTDLAWLRRVATDILAACDAAEGWTS